MKYALYGLLILMLCLGYLYVQNGNDIEPAAGSVDQKVDVRAAFRAASINRLSAEEVRVIFPQALTLASVRACRGVNKANLRCLNLIVPFGQPVRPVFPENPLGVPAMLESTWMQVFYF